MNQKVLSNRLILTIFTVLCLTGNNVWMSMAKSDPRITTRMQLPTIHSVIQPTVIVDSRTTDAWNAISDPIYNTAFLTDAQLESYNAMTADQIRQFLIDQGSYFRQSIQDVDGTTFDPAEVIAQAANLYRINPQVILATLEKENSGVTRTTRPSDAAMRFLMGCVSSSTARQQLMCAAERFRAYHDQLTGAGSTISGWQVGVSKVTVDQVTITPATKAVAGQFTYTPYAGVQWGGDQPQWGGAYLFYEAWNRFGFGGTPSPPEPPANLVVNYQAPCRSGTQAGLTTWHSNGSLDRYTYDWICAAGDAVYAPHGGTVAYSGDRGGSTAGMIMIDDTENNACLVLIHLDLSRLLVNTESPPITAGQHIGYYTTSQRHIHVAAVPGPCTSYNHNDELPIRFNELGYVPSQRITMYGTHPQSAGSRIWVTTGTNACASPYTTLCGVPFDSSQGNTGRFPDVTYADEFFPYIETLYWLHAVSGYSDGTYGSDDAATRGQAAKIIILVLGEYREYTDGRQTFPDVPSSHTFYHYIERLYELGITSGFSDGAYRLDESLLRGPVAKFIVKARGEDPNYTDGRQTFPDVPTDNVFYHYIERLYEIGCISGYSDGAYHPDDPTSRGQIAKMAVLCLPGLEDLIPTFYDVLRDHPFSLYVEGIAEQEITGGCSTSPPLFCPGDNLTRGQAAKFIIRGLGEEPYYSDGQCVFSDVCSDHTFYHYIRRLKELGISDGYSDGTYRPDHPITRGEIAKLIVRALGEEPNYDDGRQTFPDVPPTHTFYHYIERLYELGITSGYSDGTYRPDENIDRGQAAKFIYLTFVSRAPDVAQEASNGANDELGTAPAYAGRAMYVVPGGDLDYVKLTVPAALMAANSSHSTYRLALDNAGPNADLKIQVLDAGGGVLATTISDHAGDGGTSGAAAASLVWTVPALGDYYVLLTNTNQFAQEGVYAYFSVEEVSVVYLPLILH
ncbi:MAG: peptidoglycan DD-metalloendopeptidase family protein [Chloroflexi bacterium]|nr:peptidoglycan DD-metalloendopeptidase family protein [Chloroflexota bacterium]